MKNKSNVFPPQKISSKKKDEKWGEACVDYVSGMANMSPGGSNIGTYDDMKICSDLYLGIFNKDDLKYVTNPYNQDDGFPASPQNFNIIKPKIDLLIGEETKRPFNIKVARTSTSAISDMQERLKGMVYDYIMSSVMAGMSQDAAIEFQQKLSSGDIIPPEKISEFMERDYKDISESTAYHAINYLKEKLNIQNEFIKGFKDLSVVGKEVMYVGVINGEPSVERVDPEEFSHDNSPSLEFIEDGEWACRKMKMSYSAVYDRLYDKMSEKDLDKLIEMSGSNEGVGNYGSQSKSSMDYNHYKFTDVLRGGSSSFSNTSLVDVYHATWKSYKKVGFLTFLNEYGEEESTIVSEDYLIIGDEISIEWRWIIEVWEGYKIGEDLYVGIQPIDYQHVSSDNPNSQKLPYFGVLYNGGKSLVSTMKPLQYMYIILWYRLELAISRDKGKILNMDVTQIPKSMNIDVAKWMHYLTAVGVNFINPYEEGWDIPGREGGKPASFNQISEVDLTMSNVIGEYINLMSKIEDMMAEISGVSRQRQGSISSNELVGSVEKSVMQSAYITESLFWTHAQCKKNVIRALLNTAKEAWKYSDKTALQYIFADSSRALINLSDDFLFEDHDIFATDSTKEIQNIEAIKSLYQPAIQAGASLLDVSEIITLDNVSEIIDRLRKIEEKRAQMQEQASQAENERAMELSRVENETKSAEIEMRIRELDMEKYKIDVESQTKIYVAELNAYRGARELDANSNGIPDPMEIAEISLRERELDASIADREMQNNNGIYEHASKQSIENKKIEAKERGDKAKEEIEKSKIKLERDKMSLQMRLQKMKDEAAMEREKIKSKTALANKTVSGK